MVDPINQSRSHVIPMESSLATPRIRQLLESLYADAATNDPLVREAAMASARDGGDSLDFYRGMRKAYMAVAPDLGRLLYAFARTSAAKVVVEFGTSFGISTIFLAAAIRDNGGGRVITTEFDPDKAARAAQNLTAAGLEEFVEFRVGDARETLADFPALIDMVFLDGAKDLYLEVLRGLEPSFRSGGIVIADNTDLDGVEDFLAHVRNPGNRYTSSSIYTDGKSSRAHEVSVRH